MGKRESLGREESEWAPTQLGWFVSYVKSHAAKKMKCDSTTKPLHTTFTDDGGSALFVGPFCIKFGRSRAGV